MWNKVNLAALATMLLIAPMNSAMANPFADVPREHWAYDSVERLAEAGILEGYGDGTFRGERNLTRYEMAKLVARGLAKNPQGINKAELDKLAAEFSRELESLGVRVVALEKNADRVSWTGLVKYEYLHTSIEGGIKDGTSYNTLTLELLPRAEINEHWTANAEIDIYTNMNYHGREPDREENLVDVSEVYAEGSYENFLVQLGRVPIISENDYSMLMDSDASGGQVVVGNKYKFKYFAGNYGGAPYQFAEFYNDREEKFNFGLGFHRLTKDSYRDINTSNNGFYDARSANIFTGGLGYRFDDNFAVKGAFSMNPMGSKYASTQRRAYFAELGYKGAEMENPGSFGFFVAYRKLGHMAVIEPTYDISLIGLKGIHIGGEYVLAKNLSAQLQYFVGERVSPRYQGKNTHKVYTKVEWDF